VTITSTETTAGGSTISLSVRDEDATPETARLAVIMAGVVYNSLSDSVAKFNSDDDYRKGIVTSGATLSVEGDVSMESMIAPGADAGDELHYLKAASQRCFADLIMKIGARVHGASQRVASA